MQPPILCLGLADMARIQYCGRRANFDFSLSLRVRTGLVFIFHTPILADSGLIVNIYFQASGNAP